MTKTVRMPLEGMEFFRAEGPAEYPGWVPLSARF